MGFYSYNPGYYSATYRGGRLVRAAELPDEDIRGRIYDALDDNADVPNAADIDVDVKDAVVTLRGTVRRRGAKCAAWDCAWSIPQVRDVNNDIRIVSRRSEHA